MKTTESPSEFRKEIEADSVRHAAVDIPYLHCIWLGSRYRPISEAARLQVRGHDFVAGQNVCGKHCPTAWAGLQIDRDVRGN